MRRRFTAFALVVVLMWAAAPAAQTQTGEIYGRVTDSSSGVMPGVTVTIASPVLLQPMVAITSETGTYRFPQLPIGLYSVKFELNGFQTVVREGVRLEIGFNAQINALLQVATLQETITVSAVSPIVDLKDNSKGARFNQEALQALPSARDPWVMIEQTPSVAMDRQNVGGSASGQQSNFVARGAAMREQKWNLDGVDITDMSATGGSPVYFDFDAFEEMQITAGGADVTMQSPGVAINIVTKSGTDKLKGSGRTYLTDDAMQWNNVSDALRRQGVNTGNPIQDMTDYGFEVGGPLRKGRAWLWGSYGKQDINVGINNFFKADTRCQAMKAAPLEYKLEDTWTCLNSDQTILNNYNAKFAAETVHNNQFSFFFNGAEKIRNARDASDLRPIETTYRQMGVNTNRTDIGSRFWKTGMPKTYKWADRHIISDRFMVEASYAHVGNNFTLTFHEDALRDVQPSFEITTSAYARSYTESVYVRPTDSIDFVANYFAPGVMGGDHAFKAGFKYRNDVAHSEGHWGGNAIARFRNGVAAEAQMYRDSLTEYELKNRSLYVQDTYTRNRLTLTLGLRFDYQNDLANPASVKANPFFGQATYAGVFNNVTYTGALFNQLPALEFSGHDSGGITYKDLSPRVGFTYDVQGNGRSVLRGNYARYVSQNGTGTLSSTYNTVGSTLVRYPWVDRNADRFIQANEVVMTAVPLTWTSGYDYRNPTLATTTGTNDPNLEAALTDEILVGFDRQLGNEFAVSAAYIWRKYTKFAWSDTPNWGPDNYAAVNFTPTGCPAGARCEPITYYQPTSPIPVDYVYTNRPDYWREYQGFELSARKRFSKGWMLNAGYSYNNAPVHYDSKAAYEDPTNIENLDGGQFAPESTSSGLGNVFVNATWIFRLSGSYTVPRAGVNVAAFYNSREGYPFTQQIQTPSRTNGAGITSVYLDKLGDHRLPTFQTVDFRLDRPFTIGQFRAVPAIDVFNLFNGATELSIRGTQNASNANQISSILAPRVIRFGVRIQF